MTAYIEVDGCLQFTPRHTTCLGWPVRVKGMQGLWRYAGPIPMKSKDDSVFVEVIGPFFPNNPSRNGGRSRIFNISKLKYPGKNAKPVDVINVESTALSNEAKRARRR